MSIVAAMLRMTAVQALRGNTAAAAAVFDSSIEALSEIMTAAQQPAILVRIDQGEEKGQNEGLFVRSATLTLCFDLLVASRVSYQKPGNGPASEIVIEATDAGLEFSLDMLERQLRRALSDPENRFAEAFRELIAAFGPIKWSRGIDPETGRKHAIRMIEIDVEPICDPAPGDAGAGTVVDAVLARLASVEGYMPAVEIMRAELAKGAGLTAWQKLQSALMTTATVPGLLGMAPPDAVSPQGEAAEAVELEVVTPVINGHEGGAAILPEPDDQDAEL